jgi:hypothetical protein
LFGYGVLYFLEEMDSLYKVRRRTYMFNFSSLYKDETQDITDICALKYKADIMDVISLVVPAHGGKIENIDDVYFCISFPTGTRKRELYPRLYSIQYEITFPDNFTVYQIITRMGISNIQFPLQIFSDEIQMKYGIY